MAGQGTFDPYDLVKKFSDQWEKQANEMIHSWTNNREFVGFSKVSSDIQSRYLEMVKKNQELLANQLHVPTKSDFAHVAKLAIQTEEKLDALEEQIWSLQASMDTANKGITSLVEVSREMMKLTKQLKSEQVKYKKDIEKVSEFYFEIQEIRSELAQNLVLKEEISALKKQVDEKLGKHKKNERELELAATAK
ncbi:polyhydroxyalkanoate biosynthesis repressor PhaR [Neobacillus sp. OS1-2]|uniref:polyhydroxyalkanoate biosynthesis repressor PhaR n=1 Tax=Neobacillus sp. OS1-2 TaxID=3070680 RepID=UPI0027E01109|nr:polyhydroxyalkanoate biosynthesis repressor PhaR [Neobacillus sp. OS1-2]WML39672.1 polyhydroxyalkanoate biosynthesis repressor PhaR [Neobacillus sp. OS1-2]